MMVGQPPLFQGDLKDWSRKLAEYLLRLQSEANGIELKAIPLRHRITDQDKAIQDGVLLFEPGFERVVFSQNGQWRRIPSSVMNETITATQWTFNNPIVAPNVWNLAQQTANTIITAQTAFQVSQLQFAMAASTNYRIRGRVFYDTTANADFKYRFSGPASPAAVRIKTSTIIPAATALTDIRVETAFGTSRSMVGASGAGGYIEFDGILQNGVNAGTFSFDWAQNTSDAGNTILGAGSWLEWKAVA